VHENLALQKHTIPNSVNKLIRKKEIKGNKKNRKTTKKTQEKNSPEGK